MKVLSVIIIMFTFIASLQAGNATYIKRNNAGTIGSRIGKSMSESFTESFNDALRRQRELDQYEKMLEIQYQAQLRAQRELDEYNHYLHNRL